MAQEETVNPTTSPPNQNAISETSSPRFQTVVRNIRHFRNMTDVFKNDKPQQEQLIQQDGMNLKYCSPFKKNDKELVMIAVKQNGLALQFASDELKGDKQVVLQSLEQNGMSLEFCGKNMRNDREILLKALEQNVNSLKFMENHWRKDSEIIEKIVEHGRRQIKFDFDLNDVLGHYTDKYIANPIDFKCDIFCKYWKSKESGLLSLSYKQYSKEIVLQFIMLRIFFKFHKYHSIRYEEFPSKHRTDDYFIFSDSIGAFLNRMYNDSKNEKVHHKKLKSIVKEQTSQFVLKNLSGNSLECVRMFVSDWVNQSDFPSLNSLHLLIHANQSIRRHPIRDYCERIRKIEAFDRYHFLSILGEGSQGVVLACFHPIYKNVAFKIGFDPIANKESFDIIFKLLRSNKQGFVKSFECGYYKYMDLDYSFLVMEIGKDTLNEYITHLHSHQDDSSSCCKHSKEKIIKILEIFLQILHSVMNLHNIGLTHRDLDPKNILRTQDNKYKLIDLENSRVLEFGKSITMTVGKYPYMAPETHDSSSNHQNIEVSKYSDVFSLGCILFKMLAGCPLQIDKEILTDMNKSINPGEEYFSNGGVFFHAVLSSGFGEERLHKALFYQVQKVVDQNFQLEISQPKSGVTKIPLSQLLGQCVMTMIQIKPSYRLDCIDYIVIFQSILESLQNGKKLQCLTQINKLKTQKQDSIEILTHIIQEKDEESNN